MEYEYEEEQPIIMTTPLFNGDKYSDLPLEDIIIIKKDFEELGEKWANRHAWFLREFRKPSNNNNYDLVNNYEIFNGERESQKKEIKRINDEINNELKERKEFDKYVESGAFLDEIFIEEQEEEEEFDIYKYSKPVPESWGFLEAPQMASWVDGSDFGIFFNNRAIWFGNVECGVYNKWYEKIKHLYNPDYLFVINPHS